MSSPSDNCSVNATNCSTGAGVLATPVVADQCMWFAFVVNTVVIGALCLFGLFGNTLSLFVLERDRRNRVAVFLLQSLATADNLVLCVAFVELAVVHGLFPVVGRHDMKHASAPYLIKYVNPVGYMVQSCAIWITVLLAVNRYVAVCRPFVATRWLRMRRTRLQVALVVIVSIVLNTPRFFRITVTSLTDADNEQSNFTWPHRYYYNYTPLAQNFVFRVIYLNVFYTSVVLILPLVLVLTLNVLLIHTLQESKRRLRLSSLERYEGRSETNITIVMIAVVIELVLCHTPDRVLQVTIAILRHKRGLFHCPHPISYAYDISNMLIIVSSSTNFIIYFLLRPHFRATLRDRMTCVDSQHRHDYPSFQSAGPWHVDTGRTADRIHFKPAIDRNNHINALTLAAAAAVEGPLQPAQPRHRTSTM